MVQLRVFICGDLRPWEKGLSFDYPHQENTWGITTTDYATKLVNFKAINLVAYNYYLSGGK